LNENNVVNINDRFCFSCACGDNNWLLLKSSRIKCSACDEVLDAKWEFMSDGYVIWRDKEPGDLDVNGDIQK